VADAIVLTDIHKSFAGRPCLSGLSFSVAEGEIFGYLGANGAGKSTTLRILLGLLRPDSGSAQVLGLDVRTDAARVRKRVGVELAADGLYSRLSAEHNLDFFARLAGMDAAARSRRIRELLHACGLWERREEKVARWSTGMRRKLAMARAMLHKPLLLLLDEPFSGLDPVAAVDLREQLRMLAADDRVTVLLTTHDIEHVELLCTRTAVLRDGVIQAIATPSALGISEGPMEVDASGEGLTEQLLDAMVARGLILSYASLVNGNGPASRAPIRLRCTAATRGDLGVALVEGGVRLEELTTVRASLEQRLVRMMREES
jgi:ABC-2 type transport system ATP-binding protein